MKAWVVAICAMLAPPCFAWAQDDTASRSPPAPEVAWEAGARPGFIRSVGFAENTPDTPVRSRAARPDLGPVYAWKGTPLWLVVEVDPSAGTLPYLCVEWPAADPGQRPSSDCQRLPATPSRLLFAAPDNRDWPEGRYAVRLSTRTLGSLLGSAIGIPRPSNDLGTVTYAIGDKAPAAASSSSDETATAARPAPDSRETPAFPWPPPQPTVRTVLDREAAFGNATDLGGVADRLADALHAAGYESVAYYSAPGGYAMVARLEQIEVDGTPKPLPMRWSAALPPRQVFSLSDYFRALFSAPEGHYRVIVFVVSNQPFATTRAFPSREQAAAWLQGGLNVLPEAIARLPLGTGHECTALIYQFHKLGFQGEAERVVDGAPSASLQLRRTSILDEHGQLNR